MVMGFLPSSFRLHPFFGLIAESLWNNVGLPAAGWKTVLVPSVMLGRAGGTNGSSSGMRGARGGHWMPSCV